MLGVIQREVPATALSRTYRGGAHPERWGDHGDCFETVVDRPVSLAEFVYAFYTSPLFRMERLLLGALGRLPSSDGEARLLAEGHGSTFAAWRVGGRSATQLLMCSLNDTARSWFGVVALPDGWTLLQFGSSLALSTDARTGDRKPARIFRLLSPFHILYSKLLLASARRGALRRQHPQASPPAAGSPGPAREPAGRTGDADYTGHTSIPKE